jgi:hypothetical protein
LAQKQQKSATSSPKNNKGINTEYGILSKDSQGYAGYMGVKVRLFNIQKLCFAEMLTKVDP